MFLAWVDLTHRLPRTYPCAAGSVLVDLHDRSSSSTLQHSSYTSFKVVCIWLPVHIIKMEFTVTMPS